MKKNSTGPLLILFIFAWSFTALAETIFKAHAGNYSYTLKDITNHFEKNNINYVLFNEKALSSATYKLNEKGDYQIKDWFLQDWNWLQNQAQTDVKNYNKRFGGKDFLRAKIRFYQNLDFNMRTHFHEKGLSFPREWGGLNHPPFKSKIQDLSLFHQDFTSPLKNESLFGLKLHQDIDQISDSELSFENKLEILEDRKAYQKKLKLIRNAKKSILMSSLVFACDSSTKVLTDALIKKAKEGLPVYVMADSFVSKVFRITGCLKEMKKNGVQVIMGNDFFRYEGRTVYHSKKLIVDLDKAIIGGHNMINADNLSNGTDFKNRDLDLYVEGPMVNDIILGFIEDWQHFHFKKRKPLIISSRKVAYAKEDLTPLKQQIEDRVELDRNKGKRGQYFYSDILSNPAKRMNGVCRFIQQSPFKNRTSIGKAYLKILDKTQSYLGIMDPGKIDTVYEEGDKIPLLVRLDTYDMFNALHASIISLSKANVKLDYVTTSINMTGNEHIDEFHNKIRSALAEGKNSKANKYLKKIDWWNNFFGIDLYKNLIKDFGPVPKIMVWNNITFMHSKVFFFDRLMASIGSYNFNHNSTDHSYENTAICLDSKLNSTLDEIFVRDMANSIPLRFKNLILPKK